MNMRLFVMTLILSFFIGITFSYAQDSTWTTLHMEDYSIDYPVEWSVDQSGTMGTEFFIFDGPTNEHDLFSENINLMLEEQESDTITLEIYGDWSKSLLSKYIQEFRFISSDFKEHNGFEVYTLSYEGKTGSFGLHYQQVLALKEGVFYIVTFTAEQDQVELYQAYASKMLESFKVVY